MISKVTDNKSLDEAIRTLEARRQSELSLLKEHFEFTKEQLNPINIIKSEFKEAFQSPNLKGSLLKGGMGLVSGFLAKRFLIGPTTGIVGKIASTALQSGVTGLVLKNTPENLEDAKDNGISLLQKGLNKLKIK